ncbi:hypothetical protein [Sulfurisphaera ohwakuensis]|uniref:hypothetical protein n=1 Tax=Sulfurisphaera ohwakuensis TaxID=69656 RepID=UPI0036F1A39A
MVKAYRKFLGTHVLTTKRRIDFYKDIFDKGKWLFLYACFTNLVLACTAEKFNFESKNSKISSKSILKIIKMRK